MILISLFFLILLIYILEKITKQHVWNKSFRNILRKHRDPKISFVLKSNLRLTHKNELGENILYISNKYGQRNPEINNSDYSIPRIMVIGDSIAFGTGVDEQKTFPRVLENLLKAEKKNIQVINSCFGPFSIVQIYQYFKKSLLKFRPQTIILTINISNFIKYSDWVYSDILKTIQLKYPEYGKFKPNSKGPLEGRFGKFGNLLDRSYFFRFYIKTILLNTFKKAMNEEKNMGNLDALNKFLMYYSKKGKNPWYERKIYLNYFKKICNEKNIRLLVVIFPTTAQLEIGENGIPQKIIQDYANQIKIDNMNLFLTFAKLINNKKDVKKYFLDFIHLTETGHKIVAKELSTHLIKNKYV